MQITEIPGESEELPTVSPEIPLTEFQERFVHEYCTGQITGRPFQKAKSAVAAGSEAANASDTAYKLMRNPKVRAAIRDTLKSLIMDPEEIVNRLQEIAEAPIGDFVQVNELGQYSLNKDAFERVKPFIKGFGYDSNGNPKFEFMDVHAALRDLGRVHGLFKDNTQLSGPNGGAVPLALTVNFVTPSNPETADWQPKVLPSGETGGEG